ncbi:MAG: hypothetical protein FJ090_18740 [Deltaproteobacteria bacterium]|nr:hypothetical protein [Deltaproteobacteria bacterium]
MVATTHVEELLARRVQVGVSVLLGPLGAAGLPRYAHRGAGLLGEVDVRRGGHVSRCTLVDDRLFRRLAITRRRVGAPDG